jgi:hypothetical protein
VAPAAVANACPCLKKTYLADDRAKFEDTCTGEAAEEDENAPASDPNAKDDCSCLTKVYLADGRAKFTDTCSGEEAEEDAAEETSTTTTTQ